MHRLIRALRPRDPEEHHRAATTLELFFDLVTVIVIASVTAGLHHGISSGHGLEALVPFIFLFVGIWWAWMNFTWFASAFDNDDVPYRLLVMVIIAGELMFAGAAPFIFEGHGTAWGLIGWVVMRLGMVGLWLRASRGSAEYRVTCRRYAIGVSVAQICWVAVFLLVPAEPSARFFAIAGLVYIVELAVPIWAESARPTPFHRHHIIERYGLLMIISLGEILLSVSQGFATMNSDDPSLAAFVASLSGGVIVFAIWWIYFCEDEHLRTTRMPQAILWGYGHVFVFMATALLGAALAAEVDLYTDQSETTGQVVGKWTGAGLALVSLALWFVRDRAAALAPGQKLALPAMGILFLIAGMFGAPAWMFAILAVAMVVWRAPHGRSVSA